jgi:hypothetical protein
MPPPARPNFVSMESALPVVAAAMPAEPEIVPVVPKPGPPLFEDADAAPDAPAAASEPPQSAARPAPRPVDMGEASPTPVETALAPAPVMAFSDDTPGSALSGEGTLYRSGLVERRDVVGGEGTLEPARKAPPAAEASVPRVPLPISEATLSRIEIPQLNMRTFIWVTIGFAALIGLFLSARQIAD